MGWTYSYVKIRRGPRFGFAETTRYRKEDAYRNVVRKR
jgi:hypothetical protein